jgi:hypothetical protein
MTLMSSDDVMMLIVVGGVALTCLYMAAEVMSWQTIKASDLRAGLVVRELYKKLHSKAQPLVRAIRRK